MTETQACKMEVKIIKLGRRVERDKKNLQTLVFEFRQSGAWAVTPQRHRTFYNWCKFAAPKMNMSYSTLASYSSPNYKTQKLAWLDRWGDTRYHLNLFGPSAKLLRAAVRRVREIKGFDLNGTECVCILAQYYIDMTIAARKRCKEAA